MLIHRSLSSLGRVLALVTVLAFACSPATYAQDDPFGDGQADDLFDDCGEGEDPFGDLGGFDDDSGSPDPFGEDPFGDAGPKRASKRIRQGRRSAERIARQPAKRAGRTEKLPHQQRLKLLGIYSVDPLDARELRILEVLRKDVSVAFDGETLIDAIDGIASDLQIPIVFDRNALSEESMDPTSETVSLPPIENISLASALKLMLDELDLTFVVKNEVLAITTKTAASEHLVTRVYRRDSNWKLTEEQITNAIESTVLPDSWENIGGPGAIAIVNGGLVINNSMKAHTEINQLFAKLERLYAAKNSGSASSAK